MFLAVGTVHATAIIVKPVSAAGPYWGSEVGPWNTINGTGISDPTVIETGDPVPVTYPTHVSDMLSGWLALGTSGQVITFDLGSAYTIAGMHIWNSNQYGSTDRGVKGVNVEFSTTSATSGFGSLESLTFSQSPDNPAGYIIGEDKSLSSPTTARWVRFTVLSNHGDPTFAGLAEVRFVTPEPATIVLLTLGSAVLLRRRSKTA
jgi:hypothetical protein